MKTWRHGLMRRAAFSLVEVTLALMVMSVGVLAVFSMFPVGLQQAQASNAQSRLAFFAEEVFSSLRAVNLRIPWSEWDNPQGLLISVSAKDIWKPSGDGISTKGMNIAPDGQPHAITYYFQNYDNFGLTYRLTIKSVPGTGANNRISRWAQLDLWDSSLPNMQTRTPTASFGAEIFNHGTRFQKGL